jgi:hypothetical protein
MYTGRLHVACFDLPALGPALDGARVTRDGHSDATLDREAIRS